MTVDIIIRTLSLCILLAGAETLHGIARAVLLVPRIGKKRALRFSIFSGSALAFLICYLQVPGIGLSGLAEHLVLGLVLAGFMAGFDLAMNMLLLKRSLIKALQDFDPATGNLLVFGLAALVLIPTCVAWLKGTL
ncbi:MAG: hypothetical protein PHH36_08970 [Sideroxydans sp.]|nr:hypothetical protein [Sideroxydans sp.]